MHMDLWFTGGYMNMLRVLLARNKEASGKIRAVILPLFSMFCNVLVAAWVITINAFVTSQLSGSVPVFSYIHPLIVLSLPWVPLPVLVLWSDERKQIE